MKVVIDWIRNIDMRWVMGIIGLMTVIEQAIIGGHTPLSDPGSPISPVVLARIVWWCSFAVWVNGFVLMGHAGTAATWVTSSPTVTKVLAILAAVLAWALFDGGTSLAFAQTSHKPPAPLVELNGPCNPLGDTRARCQEQGSPAPLGQKTDASAAAGNCDFGTFTILTPQNLVATIQACGEKLLNDSQAALTSAAAAKDTVAISCLTPGTALIAAGVGTPAVAAQEATPTSPAVAAIAAQLGGPILMFQKYREFVNQGGISACQSWVNTVVAATAGAASGALGAAAGAAVLAPKL
jgi:hypothetical protein